MASNHPHFLLHSGKTAAFLLGCAFFLLNFILYFAPLGAAAALPVCTALAVWMAKADRYLDLRTALRSFLIFLPVLAYMAASSLWAIDAAAALLLALRLSLIAFCAITLNLIMATSPIERSRRLLLCFAAGATLFSSIVVLDLLTGTRLAIRLHGLHSTEYGPNTYSRGTVFEAIVVGALSAGLWRGGMKIMAIATVAATLAAVLLGSQLSAKVALLVSVAISLLVLARPSFRWLLPALLILATCIIPFMLPFLLPVETQCWLAAHKPSALHRIFIWNFVAEHIHQRPIFGWGLDAARRLPGGQTLVPIRNCLAPPGVPPIMGQLLPLHPHNGILQVWLELGGAGALLGFGALGLCIKRALTLKPACRRTGLAMIAGTVAAILSVAGFSFGVWQEWWLSTAVLACVATVIAARVANESAGQGLSSRSTTV